MSEFVPEIAKSCYRCKAEKPGDEFPRNRRTSDGRHYYCRECCRAYNAEYRAKTGDVTAEWRDDLLEIKKAPGYFVSRDGLVFRRLRDPIWAGSERLGSMFSRLDGSIDKWGHRRVECTVSGRPTTIQVGISVARAFMPNAAGRHVHHLNGDKTNCSVDNLFWCAGACPGGPASEFRTCSSCGTRKSGIEFPSQGRKCRDCVSKRYRLYRTEDKKQRDRETERARRRASREAVFDHYGRVCACCGYGDIRFLTVDHTNNDGAEHRRKIGNSDIYRWLVRNEMPDGFQILCANCQLGKLKFGGTCPHASGATEAPITSTKVSSVVEQARDVVEPWRAILAERIKERERKRWA